MHTQAWSFNIHHNSPGTRGFRSIAFKWAAYKCILRTTLFKIITHLTSLLGAQGRGNELICVCVSVLLKMVVCVSECVYVCTRAKCYKSVFVCVCIQNKLIKHNTPPEQAVV